MKKILVVMLLCVPLLSYSGKVRESWKLAWDPHPQSAEVDHFILYVSKDSALYKTVRIVGGTKTTVDNVIIPTTETGTFTAVLRACRANEECSADSNRVTFDRTAPNAPATIRHLK